MRVLPAALALLALLPGAASAGAIYKCNLLDGKEPVQGKLTPTQPAMAMAARNSPLIVDTDTGRVRVAGVATDYRVVQKGEGDNDFVATNTMGWGPYEKDHYLPDIITIRAWERPIQILMMQSHLTLLSGTCEPLN